MVYQNLTKTRTFKVEAKGKGFSIMEYRNGKQRVMTTYATRAEAEKELTLFAYDGFRKVIE
jgi:hypothetical protein